MNRHFCNWVLFHRKGLHQVDLSQLWTEWQNHLQQRTPIKSAFKHPMPPVPVSTHHVWQVPNLKIMHIPGMLYTLIHTCTVIHKCSVYVFNRCDGMSSCTVPVTNSVFSDPCRGTYKYLDVSFTCLPASKCDYIFTTSFSNVTVPTDPLWCYSKSVVLNLIGGTEPCKLHQCIHRTLRNWKNKIWFLQNIGIYKNDPTLLVWTGLYCVCLDPCRTPESDSTNPWGSIEPRLRTTVLNGSSFLTHRQKCNLWKLPECYQLR